MRTMEDESDFSEKWTPIQKIIALFLFALAFVCNLVAPYIGDLLWQPVLSISAHINLKSDSLPGVWLYFDIIGLILIPTAIAWDARSPIIRYRKMQRRIKMMGKSLSKSLAFLYLVFLPLILAMGWFLVLGPDVSGAGHGGALFKQIRTGHLTFYVLAPVFSMVALWCANAAIFMVSLPVYLVFEKTNTESK
jgi:hypothetical protein